jgi:DNA-nicking Smr family endonuclease
MPEKSVMDNDDISLFRAAVGPVKRIKQDQVLPARRRPRPIPAHTMAEDRRVLAETMSGLVDPVELETGDELIYRRPGIQHKVFKKLRSGGFRVEAQIDLHGLIVPEAKQALTRFLGECRMRGRKCVRVIHGKGMGSKEGRPIIKNKVNHWLQQRHDILAFCSARPVDGGTGAIYVLLGR